MLLNDEEELIKRLRDRDEVVIKNIYDLYGQSLHAVLYRLVHSEEIAEDLLIETFTRMWHNAQSYDRSSGRLYTWLLTIARKLAVDKLRRAEMTIYNEPDLAFALPDMKQPPEAEQNTPEMKELKDRLRPDQKELIDAVYFYGYSQVEASQRLKVPLGTVKNRVRSAIADLKKILQKP